MNKTPLSLALIAATLSAGTASAHHSYAMFDASRTIIIKGTVKRYELTNPHASLFVTVIGKDGKPEDWGMEAPGPSVLLRSGWTKYTVKAGDKVTVELNPLKDGRTGGNVRKITLESGRFVCANPPGTPTFELAQSDACAGTQGGPALIAAPGDARQQGNKRAVLKPGSVESSPE